MTSNRPSPPAAARREQIRALIEKQGFGRVAELGRHFDVSSVTVRADLDALAANGTIERVHGGAVTSPRIAGVEKPFEQAMLADARQKERIGAAAAALIQSGQAIVLDVGTTTTAVALAMLARDDLTDVVVITNALNIALALETAIPRFTVVVTGGTLRPMQHSLVDPLAGVVLDQIRADIAFIGCSGVDAVAGITNVNLPEADVKRRMIASAARTVVVADSSKIGRVQLSRVAALDDVHTVITGEEVDRDLLDDLRETGLTVTIAPL